MMSKMKAYAKVLRYRNVAKTVQQFSWELSKIEKAFNIDKMSEDDLKEMSNLYSVLLKNVLVKLEQAQNETHK